MEPDITLIAKLIGDTTRSRMLTALMGGKALTATELSTHADIGAATASSHLTKLVEGGLLNVRKQGRHKYFQLQNHEIASLLETLSVLSPSQQVTTGPKDDRLRKARICYDHLAGELAVSLYDTLVENGYIIDAQQSTYLTPQGEAFFQPLFSTSLTMGHRKPLTSGSHSDVVTTTLTTRNNSRRPLCKSCLDWSERRNHLSGVLGQLILQDAFQQGWATQDLDGRAIRFSANGLKRFRRQYNFSS